MIKSMTGFARGEWQGDSGALTCELRGVNHRYLDITLRLPDELRGLENALREQASRVLRRGRLECQLRFQRAATAADAVHLNEALAQVVIDAARRVESLMNNAARMTAIDVLRWPGVISEPQYYLQPLQARVIEVFTAALHDLVESRSREGARIKELISARCAAIRALVAQVRARRPEVLNAIRDKLNTRLAELDVNADPGRLEQELAFAAQKLDVDEELDRLDGHLQEVDDVLARDEPVGRRLDFLMQEFNREANTLSSKSADLATTQAAVELKVLIEQMREQIQNVE
ncbi:MAG: YicC family protein [Gammaproteobacteria bacterium]|nr:YicC family protein [Gammaproteobacteria bacterium]MBA3732412.1 YicC family protein [Gammaproteobacteria bacterium]